jgi:VIT1/CCC1 family predicted Fe2+/Mn2+ transporter
LTPDRLSIHREPVGAREVLRHYIRDLVYGANDGIITTFAVVAGVTGGQLSSRTILVVGAANLLADGLSMGVGSYLAIRSNESARAAIDLPEEEASPMRHGAMTFLAFTVAGTVPMLPYSLGFSSFAVCVVLTLAPPVGGDRCPQRSDDEERAGGRGLPVRCAGFGTG